MKERIKYICLRIFDLAFGPFSFLVLPTFKIIRKYGVQNFPLTRLAFRKTGIYTIKDHYYDPQFVYSENFDDQKIRKLHINFNIEKQLSNLKDLKHDEELKLLPKTGKPNTGVFYLNNPSFGPGDADLYYLLIRNIQPKQIIEIGAGYTSLVALKAIEQNKASGVETKLTCIEPYEMEWLEKETGIHLIRESVEKVPETIFQSLEENDILFIDSSHIIRPENDVLFEYLELLPSLKKGVIIHIHDIFTPRHYRSDWLKDELRLWNEQYLLESFLYYNDSFEIIYSLNYLKSNYFEATSSKLNCLGQNDHPASFWIRKIK